MSTSNLTTIPDHDYTRGYFSYSTESAEHIEASYAHSPTHSPTYRGGNVVRRYSHDHFYQSRPNTVPAQLDRLQYQGDRGYDCQQPHHDQHFHTIDRTDMGQQGASNVKTKKKKKGFMGTLSKFTGSMSNLAKGKK